MMHDTTSGPALVDIAGMRASLAEAGYDPIRLNPVLPVDVSTDYSLDVSWAMPDTLIGTDSHTPMIKGIGVLGWGAGGRGKRPPLASFSCPACCGLPAQPAASRPPG